MADHGRLYDNFTGQASHSHGGSYFDAGFTLQAHTNTHGKLHDLFGVPQEPVKHGERNDEFGWQAMPAIHGQQFDTGFQAPVAGDGEHGSTWFDVFRGGRTEARYMYDGRDYEGVVIECHPDRAVVRASGGETHEVGLSQFLAYRTPNEQQAAPSTPESDAEAPSAHSEARGGGERSAVPTDMPAKVGEAPQGQYTEPRSGLPEGLMSTIQTLKAAGDELDVAKDTGLQKHYYVQQNVGKARHVVNFHDGVKTHGDGSPFYDVHIANNKPALGAFVSHLRGSGYVHRDELGAHVAKSVDVTETATQGSTVKTVGHRNNCPRGGSAPCGAEVDGQCSVCHARVHDHDAVGKATTGDLGIEVPEREHKTTDHHSTQKKPGRCPHCGAVLDELNAQAESGQPERTHKCIGTGLDVLKTLVGE